MAHTQLGVSVSLQSYFSAFVEGKRPLSEAVTLLSDLKKTRDFVSLGWLSEQILRIEPNPEIAHLHAQALVELGFLSAAKDVLVNAGALTDSAPPRIKVDLLALQGRIAKQRAAEARKWWPEKVETFLADGMKAYTAAITVAGDTAELRYFPDINRLALASWARRANVTLPDAPTVEELQRSVESALDSTAIRDAWWHATNAELAISRSNGEGFAKSLKILLEGQRPGTAQAAHDEFCQRIGQYVEIVPEFDPHSADLFALESFHRQLTEIWEIDSPQNSEWAALDVARLREGILRRSGGTLQLEPSIIKASTLPGENFEKVFGAQGPIPLQWLGTGFMRASAVASVGRLEGSAYVRIGTAFLIKIRDKSGKLIPNTVLTNAHVAFRTYTRSGKKVYASQVTPDLRFRFEVISRTKEYKPVETLWASPPDRHDAVLLKLEETTGIEPLTATRAEPPAGSENRVYIIGHPDGDALHISLSDNEILSTEFTKKSSLGFGTPVRLHYRCPTKPGNSGSPVMYGESWRVLALHRAGHKWSVPRSPLGDGAPDYDSANEGITLNSISDAVSAETSSNLRIEFE